MVILVTIPFAFLALQHAQYAKLHLIREKEKSLLEVAALLEQRLPDSFDAMLEGSGSLSDADKHSVLFEKLQPILREIAVDRPEYGFGYYDKNLRIVALIPENPRLLSATAVPEATTLYETKRTETVRIPDGSSQGGKKSLLSVNYPLHHKGEIIGHVWANVRCEDIQPAYYLELAKTFGLLLIILLTILFGVWWIIWREKCSLAMLVERIKDGEEGETSFRDFPQIQSLIETVAALRSQLRDEYTARERGVAELARLDRLNLIGEMATGVVHEIRNPMTVIRGYIQRIMQKAPSAHSGQYALILNELDSMNATLTAFLSLAKNRRVEIGLHNINNIIIDLMPLIEAAACKAVISLQFDPSDRPLMVYADEKELRQLILNLARNAIEATPVRGTLSIRTELSDKAVCLTVTDTGEGIAPWHIEKIFDPFFTTKDNGTGLGLAICKSIIDRHNGRIDVKSKQGVGTTFTVEIPAVA